MCAQKLQDGNHIHISCETNACIQTAASEIMHNVQQRYNIQRTTLHSATTPYKRSRVSYRIFGWGGGGGRNTDSTCVGMHETMFTRKHHTDILDKNVLLPSLLCCHMLQVVYYMIAQLSGGGGGGGGKDEAGGENSRAPTPLYETLRSVMMLQCKGHDS